DGVVIAGPDAPPGVRDDARAVAAVHRLTPALAADRLRSASVGVVGSGSARLDVARLIAAAGIGDVRRLGWSGRGRADLAVVAPAADELDRLPAWNRVALASGVPFLLVRPWDGRMAAVGPLVLPGQTCCYECLLLRRGRPAAAPTRRLVVHGHRAQPRRVPGFVGGAASLPGDVRGARWRRARRLVAASLLGHRRRGRHARGGRGRGGRRSARALLGE